MGHLTLAWLGAPQVLHDGRALSFRTRKCLALLSYLSTEGSRQTREKLTALFWPDSDEERGRTMLRRTLSFLRESSGEADAAATPHLRVERDALSFNFTSDFDGDLQVVEQAAKEKTADLGLLRRAAGIVRGDFLEGFTLSDAPAFDEWASLQREHWYGRVRRIFDALTLAQSEAGRAEEAIETVTRWLALDGMNDDAYQRLMRLQVLSLRSESLATEPGLRQWLSNLAREQPLVRLTLKPLTLDQTRQVVAALGEASPDESSSLAAGDDALKLLAVRDALAHYEKALQFAAHAEAPDAVFHLHTQIGKVYEFVNENEKARGVYEQMLQLAHNSQVPRQECAALNRLANLVGETHGDFEAAAGLLYEALGVAQRSGDKQGSAETEWSLAHNDFYSGRLDSAHAHGAQALALAGELDLPELVARSMNVLAYVAAARLDWSECDMFAAQARIRYAALGDPVREADCLSLEATALILTGRPREGIDAAHTAYEMSRRVENLRGQTMSALNWARGVLEIGDYETALKMAREGVASARIVHDIPELIFILLELGVIQRALGDVDAARIAHLEAEQLSQVFPVGLFSQTIAHELCADCVSGEDWECALAYAEQAGSSHDRGSVPFSGLTPYYRIEALLHAGRTSQARADLEQSAAPVAAKPRYRVGYLRALGALDKACHEPEHAVDHLIEAANLAAEMGLSDELWQILAALSDVHHTRAATAPAQQDIARAAKLVRSIAGTITDQSLQRAFLATPRIRRVLN